MKRNAKAEPTLFDLGPEGDRSPDDALMARARRTDPETSHAAAQLLNPTKLGDSQAQVLALFRRYGFMNDAALVERAAAQNVRQSPSGLRSRRAELVALGILRETSERKRLESGRLSIVWGLARS